MITITEQWTNFVTQAYPHVSPTSEQYRQLKSTWFAASFDVLTLCKHEIALMDETTAIVTLERLHNETRAFVQKHIDEEFKRQNIKPEGKSYVDA